MSIANLYKSGCLGPNYNPIPPRVWSRTQSLCTYENVENGTAANDLYTYVPILGRSVLTSEYELYIKPMFLKGNVLQYKKNSAAWSSKMLYSKKITTGWTNRTKTWATQSQKYTNPNTNNLRRENYNVVSDISSNVVTSAAELVNCPFGTEFKEGGQLIGNDTVNPCTNAVIKRTRVNVCNLNTACNVPGRPTVLCWNDKVHTWYPKATLFNASNSGNKFPYNYKYFKSANSFINKKTYIVSPSNNNIIPLNVSNNAAYNTTNNISATSVDLIVNLHNLF